MKPKTIIIVRHGESEANINKTLYEKNPDHLIKLTAKGEQQCHDCGDQLKSLLDGKNITVWRSPYTRARQTADLIISRIKPFSLSIKEDPRLREQEWGNYYNLETALQQKETRKRHSYFFYRIKEGESGADVYDRISTFLETLHRDFKHDETTDTLMLSTHGNTSLIFLMRFFHWTYEEYEQAKRFKNCGYVVLELNEETQKYEMASDFRAD